MTGNDFKAIIKHHISQADTCQSRANAAADKGYISTASVHQAQADLHRKWSQGLSDHAAAFETLSPMFGAPTGTTPGDDAIMP